MFYLDGIADGYVVEIGSPAGNGGLLEAQYMPAGGVFLDTLQGIFVGGTQFAQVPGPIVLIPGLTLNFGLLSSTYSSGQFGVDSTIGRGFGTLTLSGVASTPAVLYEVSPTKIDVMSFGTIQVDGATLWLIRESRVGARQPAGLYRGAGPNPKYAQAAFDVLAIQIGAGQPAVADVGLARMQQPPVIEHQHRAGQQPPPVLQPGLRA